LHLKAGTGTSEAGDEAGDGNETPLVVEVTCEGDDVVLSRAGDSERDVVAVKEQIGLRAPETEGLPGDVLLMRPSAQFLSNSAGRARFFSSSNICTRAGKSTGGDCRDRRGSGPTPRYHDKNQEYRGT